MYECMKEEKEEDGGMMCMYERGRRGGGGVHSTMMAILMNCQILLRFCQQTLLRSFAAFHRHHNVTSSFPQLRTLADVPRFQRRVERWRASLSSAADPWSLFQPAISALSDLVAVMHRALLTEEVLASLVSYDPNHGPLWLANVLAPVVQADRKMPIHDMAHHIDGAGDVLSDQEIIDKLAASETEFLLQVRNGSSHGHMDPRVGHLQHVFVECCWA
jgi:hypothetical protein